MIGRFFQPRKTIDGATILHQVVVNNLEFKVKKEDSYNYRATKGVLAPATLAPELQLRHRQDIIGIIIIIDVLMKDKSIKF